MSAEGANGPNYRTLTYRFMSSGQWDRALTSSLEWLGKEPENLQAHRMAALSLVNLDRELEARPHIERVLAGDPNDGFAHQLMSRVQFELGEFKAADESIRRAIALNLRDADHWYHLARMSYDQGDLATAGKCAGKCAGKALELNPRDANIRNLLICCAPNSPETAAQKIKRYEEALALDPEKALIASPGDWETRAHLIDEYLAAGQPQTAAELMKAAPEIPDTEIDALRKARVQIETAPSEAQVT